MTLQDLIDNDATFHAENWTYQGHKIVALGTIKDGKVLVFFRNKAMLNQQQLFVRTDYPVGLPTDGSITETWAAELWATPNDYPENARDKVVRDVRGTGAYFHQRKDGRYGVSVSL